MRAATALLSAAVAVALLLACCAPAAATNPPSADEYDIGAAGNVVFVQMQMVEISKIDGVEQAFRADFYMLTTWAAPLGSTGFNNTGASVTDITQANIDDGVFWAPALEFINQREETTRLVKEPFGFIDGDRAPFDYQAVRREVNASDTWSKPSDWAWIIEDQRYQCDFTTPLRMEDFPFDSQYMQLVIESFWSDDQVTIKFAYPDRISGLLPDAVQASIVGWSYKTVRQFEESNPYEYNDRAYSRLVIRTLLERQPQYYLTKIIVGVLLLVFMGVWVFGLAVDEVDRSMGSLQIFGGLITFLFVAGGDTPKVPYQTRLDMFMLWSFFIVAAMVFLHGLIYFWREDDVEEVLEERREELHAQHVAKHGGAKKQHDASDVELHALPSPGQTPVHGQASSSAAAYANAGEHQRVSLDWRIRYDSWSDFTVKKWFHGLHFTRKVDVIVMPSLAIGYSIGVWVILGRAVDTVYV